MNPSHGPPNCGAGDPSAVAAGFPLATARQSARPARPTSAIPPATVNGPRPLDCPLTYRDQSKRFVPTSQTATSPACPPMASNAPSGEYAREAAGCWYGIPGVGCPLPAFHDLTPSAPATVRTSPSGENAIPCAQCETTSNCLVSL